MTSSACHLGEPTLKSSVTAKTSLIAAKVLPSEAWHHLEELDINRSVAGHDETSTEQISSLGRYQQTRSGSSDSGRLSLISSFGSLSFGGYHLGSNHPYSANPSSSDSTSRQSMSIVDLDLGQHQFYCSLMLLNSLDFCQLEHQKPISIQRELSQQRNQDQASLPSIETSSSRLSQTELTSSDLDSTASPPKLQGENLQENRPRWFIGRISSGREFNRAKGVAANKSDKLRKITVENNTKKRGSGLSIFGSGWQGQGAGKYVAAVAAATNSASFVDKLLAHMIKRNGQSAPSSMSNVSQNNNGKCFKGQAMTMSNNKSSDGANIIGDSGGCSSSCAKNNPTVSEQPKKQRACQSSGGIHLLSDLSRRLARRCGVKTKADQTSGDGSSDDCVSARKTSESCSGLSSEREVSSEKKSCSALKRQQAATSCCGIAATSELSKELSACSDKPEFQYVRRDDSKPNGSNACVAHQSMNLGSSEARQHSTKVYTATDSCLKQPACEHPQNENQLQVQQTAANNNTLAQHNNNNLISSKNEILNASSSTLNTAPSHYCFCENETCSSSGFVSSSSTGGYGGGAIVGGSGSSGYGCIGGISGGNCGDSTTTTHSCNSSTYNETMSIATPPLPSCSNCGVAGASSRGANNDSDIASVNNSLGRQFTRDSQHLHSKAGCEGQSTNQNQQQVRQNQSQQDHQFGATMAAASPIHLEANAEPQLNDLANRNTNLSSSRDHKDRQVSQQPTTEIQVFAVEDQPQQEAKKTDQVQQDMRQHKEQQHGNNKDGHLKPKTSLLTRARNSTINLASLATVTNRFSSASVGNLWHGTAGHHNSHSDYTAGELAADDSGEGGIKPLDYVARGAFDCYHPDDNHNLLVPTTEPKSMNSSSGNKLLSVASCGSTRKLSTKEKCKRQKETERVEKLKQLVSYLKSGSSQPVVSPVALEADEIELAERYKLHVILRDDLLGDLSTADGDHQQKLPQIDQSLSSGGVNKSLMDNKTINAEHNITNNKPVEQNDITKKSSLINHSIGGTTTSSPVSSSSCSSMNQAHHSANGGRSIPHIGNVTWVLRHSISDPGNNFEHSPAFSVASSSPSTRDHQHHHHHRNHITRENHPKHQQHEEHQHHQQHQDTHDHCSSCAPSSSYSGSSLSNYYLATGSSTVNRGSVAMPMHQPTSNQNQLPKLFYIDDMDMIPTSSSNSLMTAASSSVTAVPSTSGAPIQTSTPIASASSTNCCSPMSTPAIVTGEVSLGSSSAINKNSSSTSSASAWTQPQNLAIWIDNEVNSLVSDLEAKSQQLQVKNESKHNKSGKKKWLSVTGSHSSRRSSSGAHST